MLNSKNIFKSMTGPDDLGKFRFASMNGLNTLLLTATNWFWQEIQMNLHAKTMYSMFYIIKIYVCSKNRTFTERSRMSQNEGVQV